MAGSKLLKVIGIILVIVAVFMPWIVVTVFGTTISYNLPDMLQPAGSPPSSNAILMQQLAEITLVMIGVGLVIVLLLPRYQKYGAILVAAAPFAFAIGFEAYATAGFRATAEYGIGFYVAIVGGLLLLLHSLFAKLS